MFCKKKTPYFTGKPSRPSEQLAGFQKGTRWGEEKEQSEKTKDNEGWLQTAQTKNGAAVVVNFRVFFICVGEGGEWGNWSCILLQVSTNGL